MFGVWELLVLSDDDESQGAGLFFRELAPSGYGTISSDGKVLDSLVSVSARASSKASSSSFVRRSSSSSSSSVQLLISSSVVVCSSCVVHAESR